METCRDSWTLLIASSCKIKLYFINIKYPIHYQKQICKLDLVWKCLCAPSSGLHTWESLPWREEQVGSFHLSTTSRASLPSGGSVGLSPGVETQEKQWRKDGRKPSNHQKLFWACVSALVAGKGLNSFCPEICDFFGDLCVSPPYPTSTHLRTFQV